MSAKPIDKPVNPIIKARYAGVPIIAIETADPDATIRQCERDLNGKHSVTPLLVYDLVAGLRAWPRNEPGRAVMSNLAVEPGAFAMNPTECLSVLATRAKDKQLQVASESEPDKLVAAIVFIIHANRFLDQVDFMQACWNCRLAFEPRGVNLVLLGPTIKLPAELKNDVVLISEPLPDHDELAKILDQLSGDAGLKSEQVGDKDHIVDTMSGTSAFGARQILAMSITRDGIDSDQLWERKRKMIEQTPGLSVWKGGTTFADIGGLDELKDYLTRILTSGTTPVRAIGFIDEIEKALAGAQGDLSGTSQDQLMVLLKVLQDYAITGTILIGPGGTGKSEIAKAAGNVAKCPTISLDMGAMKDSLVGGSEARIRQAIEVFKAVSMGTDENGKAQCHGLFIVTCNKIAALPPELRRRFTLGTFFIDLPTTQEQEKIWPIWMGKFGLKKQPLPDCRDWTGAEIRACCEVAYRCGYSLKEAALRVVPVIKSAPESVKALRELATNRFLSASRPGVYTFKPESEQEEQQGRKIVRD